MHQVDIIQSASGINIYSTIENANSSNRISRTYKTFEEAQKSRTQELINRHELFKLYNGLTKIEGAESILISAFIIKDLILNILSESSNNNDEIIPLLATIGAYAVTKYAQNRNTLNWIISANETIAVKLAKKENQIQFQLNFPHPSENSKRKI